MQKVAGSKMRMTSAPVRKVLAVSRRPSIRPLSMSARLTQTPGPGTAAKILAYFFPHVFVSDAGQNNIESAKNFLVPSSDFTFRHAPAEEEWLPSESVDFASACMCMHYMDVDAAVRNVAKSLRPGGTFAAATYSFMLKFPGHPRLADLWYDILSAESDRFVETGHLFPAAIKGCAKANTGLDWVPLPEDLFQPGALRLQINIDDGEERPFMFVKPSATGFVLPDPRIGPADVVKHVKDDSWSRACNVDWLKGFLVSCRMGFGEETWAMEGWKELEGIIRDAGGEVEVKWPVAVILATCRIPQAQDA